jgi:Leucine-rich repeat (LRR) protein
MSGQSVTEINISDRGFYACPNLEVLQMGYNQISDLSLLGLSILTNLKVLFLQGNEIQRVEGLQNNHDLRELVLDKNKIKGLDPHSLTSLSRLRELRLEENGLRSLSNFHNLLKLQSLYLGYNRISEIGELERLASVSIV